MLLEIAIGDAYGACFEGADFNFVFKYNDLHYHDEEPGLVRPGNYTDDAQMSIGVAEALLEDIPWEKEALADKFLQVFKRDVRRGYTGYFFKALLNASTGAELLESIGGNSDKSGAAMRAGVIGLLADISEVKHKATVQAQVTHDSLVGINSAIAAALMVHYFEYDLGPVDGLRTFLGSHLENAWQPGDRVRTYASDCIQAALAAIERHRGTTEVLKQCVDYTGDTDTVAAIALAAVSRSTFHKQNLPNVLIDRLENNNYGRDYLVELDKKLIKRFGNDTKR